MKITGLSAQIRNPERVNVSIDGKYLFSLDIAQVTELGIKVGRELDAAELAELEEESQFGKLYARTLEYSLMRPRSVREVRDYLYRKTQATRYRSKKTGEIRQRPGYKPSLAERALGRLQQKGYVDDENFARWWVESRNQRKGSSLRKLRSELQAKGVDGGLIQAALDQTQRSDSDEIQKIIAKKRSRYPDDDKLKAYLARQGFSYDEISSALRQVD